VKLNPLPFPEGWVPTPVTKTAKPTDALPEVDILVVTWTKAEWEALADVLTPGAETGAWQHYTRSWAAYVEHLTWKSPAKEANCLGQYKLTKIGTQTVLCFHSELHLATDDDTAPIVNLWRQILVEAKPSLVITTGTAGGIGESTQLGDVFVVSNAKFNCTKTFAKETWAQERYESVPVTDIVADLDPVVTELLAVNAGWLRPVATRDPLVVAGGDVETVDYFGFDDTDDSYHIVSNDPEAHTEEMDDATLWLAAQELGVTTPLLSVRNASDPEVPSSIGTLEQQSKWASEIYEKYGYWTTVGSAIAVWAVIAGLPANQGEKP
jgi:nucleoside phosphorylase